MDMALFKRKDKTLKDHLEDSRKKLKFTDDIVHKKFVERILNSVEKIKEQMDKNRKSGGLASETG
jgi:hypothetical protein